MNYQSHDISAVYCFIQPHNKQVFGSLVNDTLLLFGGFQWIATLGWVGMHLFIDELLSFVGHVLHACLLGVVLLDVCCLRGVDDAVSLALMMLSPRRWWCCLFSVDLLQFSQNIRWFSGDLVGLHSLSILLRGVKKKGTALIGYLRFLLQLTSTQIDRHGVGRGFNISQGVLLGRPYFLRICCTGMQIILGYLAREYQEGGMSLLLWHRTFSVASWESADLLPLTDISDVILGVIFAQEGKNGAAKKGW